MQIMDKALELAEIQAFKTEELTMWERNHTATMLRKQQADLKDADKYALELERLYEDAKAEIEALKAAKIRAYNNGVEDGRKPDTNNKPVAWMDYLEHSYVYDLNVSGRGIPLYTHPVKEITDEEIWDWFKENTALTKESALMIARAILRKAQEK